MDNRFPTDAYTLSPMQAGMLFQSLYNPGKGLDIEQLVCEFAGLDASALEHAWQQIWQTNDVLRTGFEWVELDQPIQRVHSGIALPWAYRDWSDLPGDPREKLESFLRQDRLEGFNLNQPPLMRLTLIQARAGDFWLVWTFHHILLDGRAFPIIFKQMADAYQAYCQGKVIALQPPQPYRDYIAWLDKQDWSDSKTYWQELLRGVQNPTPLGLSRPQPPLPEGEPDYGLLVSRLSQELTDSLKLVAEQYSLTLNTLLQGAWAVLLSRYSGEQDIVFGAIRTSRHSALGRQGAKEMVGLLINTLPVRVQIDPQAPILQVLQNLRARALDLRGSLHEHISLAEVQKMSGLQPGGRLFDSILAFENADLNETLKTQHAMLEKGKFELLEHVGYPLVVTSYAGKQFKICLEYSRELFDTETARRILGHLHTVLKGISEDPACPVYRIPILTETERRQLLVEWNNTRVDFPENQCVQDLFEAQAERTPDAPAAVYEEQALTFRELNQRANQLAHYLQKLGVGPDVLVGVCVERSLEMIIGLLGILKAGGAYVPIDPTYPKERQNFIVKDSRISILLTQERLAQGHDNPWLEAGGAGPGLLICLDRDWPKIAQETDVNPLRTVSPDHLAYVIYTSGSTGLPKGAMIIHRGLANYLHWCLHAYPVNQGQGAPVHSSLSFDLTVTSIFPPLLAGKKIWLLPEKTSLESLEQLLKTETDFSLIKITPAHLNLLSDQMASVNVAGKNHAFIIGGENLYAEHVNFWLKNAPETALVNEYGPTETVVGCCVYTIPPHSDVQGVIPIGRPIDNTQLYVLDEYLQPVPVGVPGELYIGGLGLARGYINRPDLTAQKFVPNPFSSKPGERLYKTGDRVRWLSDGNLECLGRLDFQVKIRGYRIELGEIETVLGQHPAIQDALVVARTETTGQKRLVAYFTRNNESQPGKDKIIPELRNYLKQKLPDYMLPGAFVLLAQFPLTPNGKIDRKALPEPGLADMVHSAKFVPPQTPTEQTLANLWAVLLGLDQVGRYDNFFELGGDSIVSLQFISRAQAKGLYLTPRQVFDAQTIEALAQIAQQSNPVQAEQGLILGPAPLTPIQHWFFERHTANPHHFNQSVWVEAECKVELELLTQTIEYLLAHHDALRLRFTLTADGWNQELMGIQPAGDLVQWVDLASLSSAGQHGRMEIISAELQASLNIHTGPLLKVALFNFGTEQPDKLFFTIHHLAVDFVSWQILISDLWTVYDQLAGGQTPHLSGKSSSFKAWGEWLTEYARQEKLQTELVYWLAVGEQTVRPLPVDRPDQRNQNRVADADRVEVSLSETETQALLRDVPDVYHTQINDILLTALAQAFYVWTGRTTLLIDLEGHGREAENLDLSRTVGWFTSIFPVCLQLDAQENGAIIKSVKEQLQRIPKKGMGYGVLRYLNPETTHQLAGLPQAEVCFNYGGQLKTVAVQLTGSEWAAEDDLGYLLNINAAIVDGQLRVSWLFSRKLYQIETVENLAQGFVRALKELIAHCQSPLAGGYTPGDFPLSKLSQAELDHLVGHGVNLADIYPLSPMQAGMLFHSLYTPNSGVYYIQMGFQINGDLDIPRFKQAWQQALDRHTILRTGFVWQDLTEPLQIVHQQVNLPWDEQDWRAMPASEQGRHLEQLLQRERQNGFELSQAPLTKCSLIRVDENRYQFVWYCHHLLTDGWSGPILFKEIFDFYKNPTLSLPPAKPYRNYIAWLARQDLKQAEQFWRERLAGFTAPTPLGVDRDQPDEGYQTFRFELPDRLSAQLTQFAREHHLTLNTVFQGGYALLLSRYSDEAEVLFGVIVNGRTGDLAEIETRLGPFLNTLPLRVSFSEETKLLPLLQQIQQDNTRQNEYAYSPLQSIQHWSDVPAGTALFKSILIFENYPFDEGIFAYPGGLELSEFYTVEQTNYPLSISVSPGKQFVLSFGYDKSKFDLATIKHMAGHLQTLLTAMVTDPNLPLIRMPLLMEAESRQLLEEWNDTQVEYPQDKCLPELFEAQVKQTPDAVAVVFGNQQLTYHELNQRANQLAHYLRKLGVGPDVLVGICVERSLEMLVGLNGILKAGGAYVPLDPAYPAERLAFMLEDSGVKVLLIQENLLPIFQQGAFLNSTTVLLCLDRDWDQIAREIDANPIHQAISRSLAYVIYTSGSTGKPKGVQICQRSVVNLLFSMAHRPGLTSKDTLLSVTTLSFDIAGLELFLPLIAGAKLVIAPQEATVDGHQLGKLLQETDTTVMQATPATWQILLASNWLGKSNLRILCGGEALSPQLAEKLLSRCAELWNMYGPTETTIWSTIERVIPNQPITTSIGRPIANSQVYILDPYLQPVPIGVIGEIHIGGVGLAKAYLNRPELTLDKFIPNPFRDGLLYKTGDAGRFLPNGNIEFLGRLDYQVKIRGFRIELGEIEATLEQHPAVKSAIVVASGEMSGQQYLAAYIIIQHDDIRKKKDIIPELRSYLKQKLPDYMAPGAFILLDQFPTTPNGKVNRRALPAPKQAQPDKNNFAAPRSELEKILVGIWSDVLEISPVGIYDDFFDLGGNSLLSVRLLARIQQLGLQTSLRQFLENSTIARFASVIFPSLEGKSENYLSGQQALLAASSTLLTLQPFGKRLPLFLVHPSGGSALCYASLARILGNDQPCFGLEAAGLYDSQPPDCNVEQMAERYIHAVQTVAPQGPYRLAGWSFGGVVAFEMAQQLRQAGEKIDFLGLIDTMLPFPEKLVDETQGISRLINWVNRFFQTDLKLTPADFRQIASELQLDLLLERMIQIGLDVSNLEFVVQSRVFVAETRSGKALAGYKPQAYPGKITLLRAEKLAPERLTDRLHPDFLDPAWGWGRYSTQPVETNWVKGSHDLLLAQPYVKNLAKKLNAYLDQAQP